MIKLNNIFLKLNRRGGESRKRDRSKKRSLLFHRFTVSPICRFLILTVLLLFFIQPNSYSQSKEHVEVGIDEKLGAYVPVDTYFFDEEGNKVNFKSLITKPTVMAFVYYHCPGICSPLLNGLSEVVDKVEMEPGKDFNIITVSFDHREKSSSAKKWKFEHIHSLKRQIPERTWRFLTGDSINIRKLTDAAGFYFKADGPKDFLHMGSLIVLSEKGMITRYIFGTEFLPFDLKMALIEAQKGETRPTVNKILAFCYSYDRQGNKYVFNITKVLASVMLVLVAGFFVVLVIKGRKPSRSAHN